MSDKVQFVNGIGGHPEGSSEEDDDVIVLSAPIYEEPVPGSALAKLREFEKCLEELRRMLPETEKVAILVSKFRFLGNRELKLKRANPDSGRTFSTKNKIIKLEPEESVNFQQGSSSSTDPEEQSNFPSESVHMTSTTTTITGSNMGTIADDSSGTSEPPNTNDENDRIRSSDE